MVIVHLDAGLGNQMDQYALGRSLALKLNTELKLDMSWLNSRSPEFNRRSHSGYRLGAFNIQENFATPEEIKHVKETGTIPNSSKDLENIQGNVYIAGHWLHHPQLYEDILDILRKEFTLKKPFNPKAEMWRQKILSAECSVSLHFRHGDFAYNPNLKSRLYFSILPLDYYYTCIDILKYRYTTPTAFIFSNNMLWVKENLHLDIPMEFVEGCETDNEEFILMSLCKHNIVANSSFSQRASWLNLNRDKKIFFPLRSAAEKVQQFTDSLTPDRKNTLLESKNGILVPFDYYNQPEIKQQPIFSLLMVVNDCAASTPATLNSLLNQDYKYYEVIIIDNATTNGSDKICQDAVKDKTNVIYKRLDEKISNAKAWNEALKLAQGQYVSFLKVGDQFLNNSLASLYVINENWRVDIIHMFSWLEENASGDVAFDNKKFSTQRDAHFKETKNNVIPGRNGFDAARLLLNQQINSFLGTKLYNREFLTEHGIKFDEQLDNETAEFAFQAETFFKTKYLMYLANAFFIASLQKSRNYFTARIDIQFNSIGGDFQILSLSDDKANIWKPAWFQKRGIGHQIQSYAGKLEIVAKATVDGQIFLHLRGIDIRSPEDSTKRIPYWIDYTKFIVNDKVIFDKVTPAWHDQTYFYKMDAKANEEIKFQVEWVPHKGDN